jgi:hypothetical protein
MTNQQIINAIYEAAGNLGIAGWALLENAGLTALVTARDALYQGPEILAMAGLTAEQKQALLDVLGLAPDGITPAVDSSTSTDEPSPPPDPEPTPEPEPEPVPEPEPEPQPEPAPEPDGTPPYPGLTNQDIINAFYGAGKLIEENGWILITQANLTHLAQDRTAEYTGPAVPQLAGLDADLREKLLAEVNHLLGMVSVETPYPGLVNQDIINLFYTAASAFGENGWHWIARVGLTSLAATREARYQPYSGPEFQYLAGLNDDQKDSLLQALTALQN